MAKYTKRTDGRYQANITIGYDPKTGIRKYETIYAKSISELENKKSEIKSQINKGIYANDRKFTLGKWADKWFLFAKASSSVKTKEMYERLVYTHIIPALGDIRLKDLKKSDIQEMINERAEHPRTCQQLKMCINQILESAIDEGLLFKNVCRNINLPIHIKEEKRALTEIEKKAILQADFTDKEKAFVYIIQYCGLRRGEALALSINDIDFANNQINIRNSITFDKGKSILKPIPKSLAGIRSIPMPTILREFLITYVKSIKGLYLFEMERKEGIMTKSSYDKFWKKIVQKINKSAGGTDTMSVIHNLGAHVFRHNYATMLFYAGIDIKEAQYLLGHSDVKLTLNIYTHLEKDKMNTANKLDNFLSM